MGNFKISPDFQQDIRVFRLFVESVSFHSRIFHSFGDVAFAGEGLQILTYARHLWPLSSEGSLACHTRGTNLFNYNGHLQEPVTLAPNTKRFAIDMLLPALTNYM